MPSFVVLPSLWRLLSSWLRTGKRLPSGPRVVWKPQKKKPAP